MHLPKDGPLLILTYRDTWGRNERPQLPTDAVDGRGGMMQRFRHTRVIRRQHSRATSSPAQATSMTASAIHMRRQLPGKSQHVRVAAPKMA